MRNELGRILFARNLREHQIARRAGVTQSHLNRIKNGRVLPSLKTALRICKALSVPVDEVFRLERDGPKGRPHPRGRGDRRPCPHRSRPAATPPRREKRRP